ncbi:hypothetical protein BH10ACT3_BH10ACT3_07460 [soil metagenome]
MDERVEPPEPGCAVWCTTAGASVERLARVEGFEDSVVVEFWKHTSNARRRPYLRNYFVRTDPNLRTALDKLIPVGPPSPAADEES